MADFADGYWTNDELKLHYRDYAGGGDGRPVVLCLAGLTRNVRDFAGLAERLAPAWRVIAVDFRGRGDTGVRDDRLPPFVRARGLGDVATVIPANVIQQQHRSAAHRR